MDFLRRPTLDAPLWADAELVKLGRALAVVRVTIWSAHPPPDEAMTISVAPPSRASIEGAGSAIKHIVEGETGNRRPDRQIDRVHATRGGLGGFNSDVATRQLRVQNAHIPAAAPVAIATVTYAIPPRLQHAARAAKL